MNPGRARKKTVSARSLPAADELDAFSCVALIVKVVEYRRAAPATSAAHSPKSLCQSLCQRRPIGPVLPVLPSSNYIAVNNLAFLDFHGMEEVIGSIPIRSTNKPNNLADSQKKRDTLSIRWFSCCTRDSVPWVLSPVS